MGPDPALDALRSAGWDVAPIAGQRDERALAALLCFLDGGWRDDVTLPFERDVLLEQVTVSGFDAAVAFGLLDVTSDGRYALSAKTLEIRKEY